MISSINIIGIYSVAQVRLGPMLIISSPMAHKAQGALMFSLRNTGRKHVPCVYRVLETRVEVWGNEKCCGNMSRRRVFPQFFLSSPKLSQVLIT